jgi:hypothetical protein
MSRIRRRSMSRSSTDKEAINDDDSRFLMNINRPQRFGTQYRSDGPNSSLRLYQVDSGVIDELRRALNVPSLAQAKAREAEFNKKD